MNESTNIQVEFPCVDGGCLSGSVLATPLGANLYRLEETPFAGFVDEAGYGDVIEVVPNINGDLVFQSVVQKSNYKHFDFLLPRVVVESEELKQLFRHVEAEGGQWEVVFGGGVLISLPLNSELDVLSEIQKLRATFVT